MKILDIVKVLIISAFLSSEALAFMTHVEGRVIEFNYEDDLASIVVIDKEGKETQITLGKGGECFLNEHIQKDISFMYYDSTFFSESAGENITRPVVGSMTINNHSSKLVKSWLPNRTHDTDKRDKAGCINNLISVFSKDVRSAVAKEAAKRDGPAPNLDITKRPPYDVTVSPKPYVYEGETYRHVKLTSVYNKPFTISFVVGRDACKFYFPDVEFPLTVKPGETINALQRASCDFILTVQVGNATNIHTKNNTKVPVFLGY